MYNLGKKLETIRNSNERDNMTNFACKQKPVYTISSKYYLHKEKNLMPDLLSTCIYIRPTPVQNYGMHTINPQLRP